MKIYERELPQKQYRLSPSCSIAIPNSIYAGELNMDKFVMMKKKNGTRVRTKDLWGVQIHGGKYYIYCNRKPICYGAMRPGLTPSEILRQHCGETFVRAV